MDQQEQTKMDMDLTESDYIWGILNDFKKCDSNCENCKAYERLNSTQCAVCELLLTYRNDISNAITKLIDQM